jgi:acyl-coenzyme A thioesterase 13
MIITIFGCILLPSKNTSNFFEMSELSDSAPPLENKRLEFLQKFIGRHLDQSPSAVGRWLNGKLIAAQKGHMEVEFTVREDMTNSMGMLHGGIASAILDDVVGTMVYALGREFAFTSVNLNCDFLHAGRVGDVVLTKAKVIREGKNIIHVEGEIVNSEGKIIAKCTSNMIQTSVKLNF